MAEWSIATVLKTVSPSGLVGSNPTPSANLFSLAAGGQSAIEVCSACGTLPTGCERDLPRQGSPVTALTDAPLAAENPPRLCGQVAEWSIAADC